MVILHRRKAFRTVAEAPPGDPPSFVAVSAPTTNANVNVPAGISNGNLLIAFVVHVTPASLSIPAGWTQLGTTFTWSPLGYGSALAYRIANSEPASYSFAASGNRSGFIIAYTNATGIDVSGSFTNLSGTSMTLTGITSSANSMLLSFIQDRDPAAALTKPAAMTSRQESTSTFWRHGAAELLNANSDNRTWTVASSTNGAAGILVSII